MVFAGFAVCFEGLHNLHDHTRKRHGDTKLVGGIQGIGEVFDMQLDAETRLEIAVQHQRQLRIQDRTACQTAPNGLEHLLPGPRPP